MHRRSPGDGPLACSRLILGTILVVRVFSGIAEGYAVVRPSVH